jgi:hypothetical protein
MQVSQMNESVEWNPHWEKGESLTRVIAGGFQNVFHPNHTQDEPLYSVIKSGKVVESLQSILTPRDGDGMETIGWRSCILASVIWKQYPKYGVWLTIDLATLEPIQAEYQGSNYALASTGEYTHIQGEIQEKEYNAHIWRYGTPSQYTVPANISWWKEGSMIIDEIFRPSFITDIQAN